MKIPAINHDGRLFIDQLYLEVLIKDFSAQLRLDGRDDAADAVEDVADCIARGKYIQKENR